MKGNRIAGFALAWTAALGTAPAVQASGTGAIVDERVEFQVRNTNTSGVPCPSDGSAYTVRGHLVGPRSALAGPGPRAVTVYLHGFNVGGYNWRPPGLPQLDHPAALARLGHGSLTVDRLGYDESGHPDGWQSCFGSQADVAHQLVEKLRSGDYAVSRGSPTTFSTVVLGGHDSGAAIANIVAYSYNDIDAVVHFNWAEQGFTQKVTLGFADTVPVCASGGEAAEQGPPERDDVAGGPSGYVQFLTDPQIREEQFNTEPEMVDRLLRLVNRNPCGEFSQVPQVVQINTLRLPEIRIPVLYGYTEHEFVWTQEGLAQQAQHYRNSSDLTTVVIRDAGHFPMFSRVAHVFHATVAEWLRSRGFLSAAATTAEGCPAANRPLVGTPAGDRLMGTESGENMLGRGGDDSLAPAAGRDCVRGGDGNDRIRAADGERDRVRCGPGRDRVRADRLDVLRGCERIRRPAAQPGG